MPTPTGPCPVHADCCAGRAPPPSYVYPPTNMPRIPQCSPYFWARNQVRSLSTTSHRVPPTGAHRQLLIISMCNSKQCQSKVESPLYNVETGLMYTVRVLFLVLIYILAQGAPFRKETNYANYYYTEAHLCTCGHVWLHLRIRRSRSYLKGWCSLVFILVYILTECILYYIESFMTYYIISYKNYYIRKAL